MPFGSNFFEDVVPKKDKPSNLDMIHYMFWEKGISLNDFNELPIPYIMNIIKTFSYIKEEEKKESEKARRKGK